MRFVTNCRGRWRACGGPWRGHGRDPDDAAILRQAETGAIVSCAKSGYLQHVDHSVLVAAARSADALIVLRFRPGQFVLRGEPLAAIVPAEKVGTLEAAIDRGFHIGRHRTLTQDKVAAILVVVESCRRVEAFVAGYLAARIVSENPKNGLLMKLKMTGAFDRSANDSHTTAIDPP